MDVTVEVAVQQEVSEFEINHAEVVGNKRLQTRQIETLYLFRTSRIEDVRELNRLGCSNTIACLKLVSETQNHRQWIAVKTVKSQWNHITSLATLSLKRKTNTVLSLRISSLVG